MTTAKTLINATTHLAKWESFRPISDRGLIGWAQEQHAAYSLPHHSGPRPHTATLVWMSWECARLRTSPQERDELPMLPPTEAVWAWEYDQKMNKWAEVAKLKAIEAKKAKVKFTEATKEFERKADNARKAAAMAQPLNATIPKGQCKRPVEEDWIAKKATEKANAMSPAPKVLRKLPIFSRVSGMASKSVRAAIVAAQEEDQITVSSASGGLRFYRGNHDESKCEFCKALRKDSQ